jgi:hypothetical protein
MTPEEIELGKKFRVLERLKDRLADREEEMADLRAELEQFEARYTMEVARLYADLDEIEAQIAEEEYKLVPDDEEIKKKAEELRRRAEESAVRAAEDAEKAAREFKPSVEAKKAYHDIARIIHPDLALDAIEKERRHELMADLNRAYSSGDEVELSRLADEYRVSPEVITGDSTGDQLVRVIRQLSQVRARLNKLNDEKTNAESSERYELRQKVDAEMAEGRDMLAQMAARTRVHIRRAQRRLNDLKNLNVAQEEYVKEYFGMDIEDFRR